MRVLKWPAKLNDMIFLFKRRATGQSHLEFCNAQLSFSAHWKGQLPIEEIYHLRFTIYCLFSVRTVPLVRSAMSWKIEKLCWENCHALGTKINHLLRCQTTSTSTLNVDVLANYFQTKIETIRQSLSGASRSNIEPRIIEPFTNFKAVTVDEIIKLLHTLPSKQCSLDTLPTWLGKSMANHIAPLLCAITAMCNASLKLAVMPVSQKQSWFTLDWKRLYWIWTTHLHINRYQI